MIYKVLSHEDVETLKEDLHQSLPGTAKIFYVVRNVLKEKLSGLEVLVDNWPKWSCVVLRPKDDEMVPRFFRHTYMIYAKNVATLKYFIQRPGVIDWDKQAIFTGVPSDLLPALQEMTRKHGGKLMSKEPRLMYSWKKSEMPELPQVPEGVKLTSLSKEHASIMREDWEESRTREDMEGYFSSVVDKFDSSCLINESDNSLLAYICMQYNGSMALLFVRSRVQEKKEEFFNLILCDLTRKLLSKNEIAYGFIPTQDTALINLCRRSGFEWVPQGDMTWVQYQPPAISKTHILMTKLGMESTAKSSEDGDNTTVVGPLLINAIPLTI